VQWQRQQATEGMPKSGRKGFVLAVRVDVQYWHAQLKALEGLADEKDYGAIQPRRVLV